MVAILCTLGGAAAQNENKHERDYVKEWCSANGGEPWWRVDDGTKVDCLTDIYAVEIKRAGRWNDVVKGIGQAIHYAQQTERQPGIVLIIENREKGCPNLRRLRKALKGVVVNGNPVELLPPVGPEAERCPK